MLDVNHISTPNKNTQIFYASNLSATAGETTWQTWQKPPGVTLVHFFVLGGGGGGGAGSLLNGGNSGGGGGSSAQCSLLFPAWSIPDTLYIAVGTGGAGQVPGGGASAGIRSLVAISPNDSRNYILCFAWGGGGGQNGSQGGLGSATSIADAPLASLGFPSWGAAATNVSLIGQSGGNSTTGVGGGITLPTTGLVVTGGTGGGGNGAAGAGGFAGGAFSVPSGGVFPALSSGVGGSTTTSGTNGSNGVAVPNLRFFYGGTGGGSGGRGAGAVTNGGNGGAGSYGCGGGGGGGAQTGTPGSGGRGGDGLVIATAW
jgi:hypothetical protein